MPNVRWNLAVSEDVDRSVRMYLAESGGRKGDLSRFVEEAVRDQIFHQAVAEAKAANADTPQDELETMIDEALDWARTQKK